MAKQQANGDQIGATGGGWAAYTPTLSSSSGAFTSANATGKYKRIGGTVHYQVQFNIVTNGTAAGPRFTLPITAKASNEFIGSGREDAVNGKLLQVKSITTTVGHVWYYDNTDPNANGLVLRIAGTYEAA